MTYETTADAGPHTVAEAGHEWTDESRDRPIAVRVYAPAGVDDAVPCVVLSHGMGESRDSYAYLTRYWASYGYGVVTMTHEGSDDVAVAGLRAGDRSNLGRDHFSLRFADLQNVLDRILDGSLGFTADPSKLGVAGHSMGSDTSYQAVGMTITLPGTDGERRTFREPRIKASLGMGSHVGSAADPPDAEKHTPTKRAILVDAWDQIREPTMVFWGTRDHEFEEPLRSNPDARKVIYDKIPAAHKYMVDIVNLAHHTFSETDPWYPGGPRDPRHHGWIQQITLGFYDAHVRDDASALAWLQSGGPVKVCNGEVAYDYEPK